MKKAREIIKEELLKEEYNDIEDAIPDIIKDLKKAGHKSIKIQGKVIDEYANKYGWDADEISEMVSEDDDVYDIAVSVFTGMWMPGV